MEEATPVSGGNAAAAAEGGLLLAGCDPDPDEAASIMAVL